MAESDKLHCTVVTPERKALAVDATFVAFPAHDGEMGILRDRAPLLCKMGIGILRVETGSQTHRLFVDGGFAQMLDNKLTLLTEQARTAKEIDRATLQQQLSEAQALKITDDASFKARDLAIQRVQAQLKLVETT